jgi:hypothetical protein
VQGADELQKRERRVGKRATGAASDGVSNSDGDDHESMGASARALRVVEQHSNYAHELKMEREYGQQGVDRRLFEYLDKRHVTLIKRETLAHEKEERAQLRAAGLAPKRNSRGKKKHVDKRGKRRVEGQQRDTGGTKATGGEEGERTQSKGRSRRRRRKADPNRKQAISTRIAKLRIRAASMPAAGWRGKDTSGAGDVDSMLW